MELKGKVVDGVVVPDRGVELPDGAEVRIEILKKATKAKRVGTKKGDSLSRKLLALAGTVKGLPSDYALNHRHYRYGAPKKS